MISLNDLKGKYKESKFDVIKYKIKEFSYNLHPRKFKQMIKLIRLGWTSWYDVDYAYSLQLLKFGIEQLQEAHDREQIYVGQEKRSKEMKIFLECLDRLIKDEYGMKKEVTRRENKEMLLKYMKNIDKWWL